MEDYSERDHKILNVVRLLGVATSSQILRLVFDPDDAVRSANRRLQTLFRQGLLHRLVPTRQNEEIAYTLTEAGALLLQSKNSGKVVNPGKIKEGPELVRCLALSEFAVRLTLAAQQAGWDRPKWVGQLVDLDGFEPGGVGILAMPAGPRPFFVEWRQGSEDVVAGRLNDYASLLAAPARWSSLAIGAFPPLVYLSGSGVAGLHREIAIFLSQTTGITVWLAAWADLEAQGVLAEVFYRVEGQKLTGPASLKDAVGV